MKCPPPESLPFAILILINRLSLGLLFFFAGIRKLLPDEAGQTLWVKLDGFASHVASQAPLPLFLGKTYGFALPFVEIVAGFLVAVGLLGRVGASVIALMLLSFMMALGIDFWSPQGSPFDKNVILFTLALLLVATGSGRLSLGYLIRRH